MNTKFLTLLSIGAGAVTGCGQAPKSVEVSKPNLLIIHTDEHNFRTLSCYQNQLPESEGFVWGAGCNVETPNIDRIASEGAICMSYYCATPVSSPSRAAMITGLYPRETDVYTNEIPIRQDVPTFASILRENGYATSYVGKWHLAGTPEKYTFDCVYDGGFTDNKYMMNKGHSPYFEIDKDGKVITAISENAVEKAHEKGHTTVHMTDYFTDKTLEILERDKDKPFCLMLSIPDPHTPDYARPPYNTMYDDMTPTMPETMKDEYASLRPKWGGGTDKNEATEFEDWRLKQYFGMVKHIDDSVGKIISYLEKEGVLDNTIVIFTSDHGDMFYEHRRMNKGNPYEASARIPFVIRYPEKVAKGSVITKAMSNVSLTPTLLGLMDVKSDAVFSGENDAADFSGNTVANQHRLVYSVSTGSDWIAAIDDQYKLVLSTSNQPWLSDRKVDPMEVKNFYNDPKYADVVARMQPALLKEINEHKILAEGKKLKF